MPAIREIEKEVRQAHRTEIMLCMLGSALTGGVGTIDGLLLVTGHSIPSEWAMAFLIAFSVTGWSLVGWLRRDEDMDG